ncbi:hypothetical protein FSP39_006166 [Pinctada imbricata]|uniref:Uncharacterized protein n=1 Tax=Pinctada imbricata TaxID=66713 RepID=A0AA89BLL8_PINIB|nr:hypothetical protein FSP39_006166 [Pinctada imbricata]
MANLKHVSGKKALNNEKKAEMVFPEIQALRRGIDTKDGRSRCGSEPASRSNSFKNRPRPKGIQNVLDAPPRRNSMPDTSGNFLSVEQDGEPLRRVRSFKMTSKGIVNRGDSFRHSNSSLNSADSGHKVLESEVKRGGISKEYSSDSDSRPSTSIPNVYKVALCGSVGVGKTALVNQFKTSEYMGGFEIAIGRYELN